MEKKNCTAIAPCVGCCCLTTVLLLTAQLSRWRLDCHTLKMKHRGTVEMVAMGPKFDVSVDGSHCGGGGGGGGKVSGIGD